jgi:GNAT superfamily N-acetyltransferase
MPHDTTAMKATVSLLVQAQNALSGARAGLEMAGHYAVAHTVHGTMKELGSVLRHLHGVMSPPIPNSSENPSIRPLRTIDEAETVARWIWDEWAVHEPGNRWEDCISTVAATLDGEPFPRFFVAEADNQLIGCSSILACDLPSRPDLYPWLANVFVLPAWRGRGVGRALIDTATAHGLSLSDELFLFTTSPDLYRNLGWQDFCKAIYGGQDQTVMRLTSGIE